MGQCMAKLFKRNNSNGDKYTSADIAGGNVHLVTTMANWEEIASEAINVGKIVAMNFSVAWCTPCREITPVYRELADKYSSILFLTVDVDELAELSNEWDIIATPTFYFIKNGRELDKLVGAHKQELRKKIMAVIDQ